MHDEFHVENEFRFRASSELNIPRRKLSFSLASLESDRRIERAPHVRIENTTKRDSSRTTATMMKKMILPLPRRRLTETIHPE